MLANLKSPIAILQAKPSHLASTQPRSSVRRVMLEVLANMHVIRVTPNTENQILSSYVAPSALTTQILLQISVAFHSKSIQRQKGYTAWPVRLFLMP